ncbi:hypothetical protein CLAFUW4_10314 [Fulvia fulva]|uniref:Uncharacterized protein n=1 Tax=Passalora fulva TaxID=5499 RepID=A0A9Q8LEC6_PASFU|nr:uncharacterized protein CLAFUR5_04927 [Fulvia fulva]KAK4616339.1 hypothetical protein CLAFUR4_10318 [Fulvia fulva]KAK4616634.1 hypothetical protein CLAFUR0_10316 [Fulvia fulva]UJO15837.1 hypothetical protein CLAFUR5_04927 [Fulvia fulva]WPV19294.1 hypothetical protein CLAFUW4_10314 [Fulvia fulva]WPV34406.1 hypothetical protein CLAFUW7_10314 [Fulvia fulva]
MLLWTRLVNRPLFQDLEANSASPQDQPECKSPYNGRGFEGKKGPTIPGRVDNGGFDVAQGYHQAVLVAIMTMLKAAAGSEAEATIANKAT